jgi:hypothetical protein
MTKTTLYERLGGYDAICAVTNDLPRILNWLAFGSIEERMARKREKQLRPRTVVRH